jgi:hypothetical protein
METYYTDDLGIARAHARKLARKRHMSHYIVRWPQGYEVVASVDMYYSRLADSEKIAQDG